MIKKIASGFLMCSSIMPISAAERSQPNIVFILVDDFRHDALGFCGNQIVKTPTIDQLARNGVFFRNAISSTPISSASRASILTGLYERTHRYSFQTGPLENTFLDNSYPLQLRKAGYKTALFGKLGVVCSSPEVLFDEIEDYDRNTEIKENGYFYKRLGNDTVHLTRYTGEKGVEYLESQDGNKPFFLSLCFSAPHAHDTAKQQYFWDKNQNDLYNNSMMPAPRMSEDKYFYRLPQFVKEGFSRLRWTWRFDNPEKYQLMMKGYYRMISGVDQEIERILNTLRRKGLDKNTVVVFMGDNGYFLGERQLADKWMMYDLSVKIPLIIYDPRINEHKEVEEQVLNVDIPSTLVKLANGDIPSSWQGKSLVNLLRGKETRLNRDTILIEHLWEMSDIPSSEGVRTTDWKYFRYINDKRVEELYNLQIDPDEAYDLSNDKKYAQVLQNFRKKTDELSLRYSAKGWIAPETLRVDYIRKPEMTVVRTDSIIFSWSIPVISKAQKAYQILVSSSKENLECNVADIWDSRYVRCKNTTSVSYKGKPLQLGERYYWKVRFWDYLNRTSEYSEMQEFVMASSFDRNNVVTANPLLTRIESPQVVKCMTNQFCLFDFGKSAFANLSLKYSTFQDNELIIRVGEKINEATGRIDMNPGGTIRSAKIPLTIKKGTFDDRIHFQPDMRNTGINAIKVPDSLGVLLPFRYVEVSGDNIDWNNLELSRKIPYGYTDAMGHFESSDTLLNRIWELCKYTIQATDFLGYYIDGDRERIPYEADAYINQLCHYVVDSEYGIAKKTLEYFMTHPTWPTEWLLHTPMIAYQDYYYTGDKRLIIKYYDTIKKKTLHELAREDGLISSFSNKVTGDFMCQLGFPIGDQRIRDIVDWPSSSFTKEGNELGERDGHEMMPYNTVVNCFFYQALVVMTELANAVGKSNDATYFSLMSAKVKNAINTKLFDETKGLYIDGEGSTHSSLHSNMFPLAFGLVEKSHQQKVVSFVKSRGMACSVYGAQYLFEGLYKAREAQYALDLLTNRTDRSWYNMLQVGSTMTLEAWDIKYKGNLDWNHAWGAAPANLISRMMWGITPSAPGYEKALINPQLADLKCSEITVPTLLGNISASYKVQGKNQLYIINIPANMGAHFILAPNHSNIVLLNGIPQDLNHGKLQLAVGKNTIEIQNNTF